MSAALPVVPRELLPLSRALTVDDLNTGRLRLDATVIVKHGSFEYHARVTSILRTHLMVRFRLRRGALKTRRVRFDGLRWPDHHPEPGA